MYIVVLDLMLWHTFRLCWSMNITFIYIGKLKNSCGLTLLQWFLYCRYGIKPTTLIMHDTLKIWKRVDYSSTRQYNGN